MPQITVSATDSQGKTHIFNKPTPFDLSNDPFLFGLERGRKEATNEIVVMIRKQQLNHDDEFMLLSAINTKFGIEI